MDQIRAIGTAVRRARREAGLTQAQHAELAETSERTIRDIEKGTGSVDNGRVAAMGLAPAPAR